MNNKAQRMANNLCGVGAPAGTELGEVQQLINKMCGIDDETAQANKDRAGDIEIDETQRMINALFGIDDETFRKYGPSGSEV